MGVKLALRSLLIALLDWGLVIKVLLILEARFAFKSCHIMTTIGAENIMDLLHVHYDFTLIFQFSMF